MSKFFIIALISLFLISCTSASFTRTNNSTQQYSNDGDIDFKILSSPPKERYEEIGIIEFKNYPPYQWPSSASEVRDVSSEYVAINGGNALILGDRIVGYYINAIVIRIKK